MTDIFEFWSRIKRGERIHPADKEVFDRMNPERHGFKLDCLPGCFAGPLKTASVVLLYLSPGYSEADEADAKSNKGKDYRFRSWKGHEPFRNTGPGESWLSSRTRNFCDYETVRNKFAILKHWRVPFEEPKGLRVIACFAIKPRFVGVGSRDTFP